MPKKAKRKRGLLVVISGPSGVGKSTVVRRLFKLCPDLEMSISSTTRSPRPGEEHGHHYFFVTQEEFDAKVKQDQFLEWAKVHGSYYGTPRKFIDQELGKGKTLAGVIIMNGNSLPPSFARACVNNSKIHNIPSFNYF